MPRQRLAVVLFGPTSSGKTALSLDLADWLAGKGRRPVVLNADSRQVYVGMDIGTSKLLPADRRGVDHRLLDIVEPARKLELEAYAGAARAVLHELEADATAVPVVVGGTGTYVSAITDGWRLDGSTAALDSVRKDFPPSHRTDAYELLERIAPAVAKRVHPNNYDVIVNALARQLHPEAEAAPSQAFEFVTFALDRGAARTDKRIEQTLDAQLRAGLLDEVIALAERYDLVDAHRRGRTRTSPVLQTHAYREFIAYAATRRVDLRKLTPAAIADIRGEVLDHIWAYSRRQRSWFRKLPRHTRISPDGALASVTSRLD